ncbi:twin-arginine translocation signal domain-containing protein [Halarchaeum sp. P4]|uniref:twin-arginine translocation signal domain-containing protein n=1 Tax=Halarchaeum sp. P4 TaxID=3421639 RepID=UPI003EBE3E01
MAEKISRREFLGVAGVGGGSFLAGWLTSDGADGEQGAMLPAARGGGDRDVAERLGEFEFWRAADTEDYGSIEIDDYPALILVEDGEYEGIRIHKEGEN